MKKYFLGIIWFSLLGCASLGKEWKYEYVLESTGSLSFEDDLIKSDFQIDKSSIKFTIKNKNEKPFKIIWDDAAIVIDGKAYSLTHQGVKFVDMGKHQVSSMVPPQSEISDAVIPTHNIYFISPTYNKLYSNPGGWVKLDLFPTNDQDKKFMREVIIKNKGKKLSLYLPLQIDSLIKYYDFGFIIKNVVPENYK